MQTRSTLTHLECGLCGATYAADQLMNLCSECDKPLLARYDLAKAAQTLTPHALAGRVSTLWRYEEVLPVRCAEAMLSLGEGWTPLLHAARLGEQIGCANTYIKDESLNPTGSFKARGLSLAVSRAFELGARELAIPSAGNAAGAMSAYAALAGLPAHVFMPADVPMTFRVECQELGANVTLIDGLITDCGVIVRKGAQQHGWFDVSTLKEPYRLEGKKTMGYELAEQFAHLTAGAQQAASDASSPQTVGAPLAAPDAPSTQPGPSYDQPSSASANPPWNLPDVVIYPTGGGTGLVGMWKAFDEMEAMGLINSKRPRMVSVQSEGCAPIVRAFDQEEQFAEPWQGAKTVADGLRVPAAVGDFLILNALRASSGTAVAVSDADMLTCARIMGRATGIFPAPEGAACLVAQMHLLHTGWIQSHETVILFNTGTGLKYTHLWQ